MTKTSSENGLTTWRFRREVTLGTVVQLVALVIVLVAAWTSLKEELTYIRVELNQMVQAQTKLQDAVQRVSEQSREHAYRLGELEEETTE
jgi:type II secretory pathway component PulM